MADVTLKRSLSFWLTFAYGLGSILGAGIYVLIGKVAAFASFFTPLSFLIAACVAAFTSLSYGELCARYPKAAGEATYAYAAFQFKWISGVVGWMVVITGVCSAGTLARGFVGYFHTFFSINESLTITVLLLLLGLIAIWGITQSVIVATAVTLLEVAGLILVIVFSGWRLSEFPSLFYALGGQEGTHWSGVFLGAFLAFYAYIGFEDMVNIAEEVKNPRKNLPMAIFLALGVATFLYIFTSVCAILTIPLHELVESDAPFALLFEKQGISPLIISLISLVAIFNSALIQVIMASRVLYGMGQVKTAPKFLSHIQPETQTPIWATSLVIVIIWILALTLSIVTLAQITSFVILLVFAIVNLSLIVIKFKQPAVQEGIRISFLIPMIGLCFCFSLLILRLWF